MFNRYLLGSTILREGEGGAAGGGAKLWYDGADADMVAALTSKGWDKLEPAQAALQAFQSYRNAEKLVGAPPDKVIRLPNDPNDVTGMRAVWQRLGAPGDPKDYDFATVKNPDGTPVDQAKVDFYRSLAAEFNLPKDAAPKLGDKLLKAEQASTQARDAENAAKLLEEQTALNKLWGQNAPAHKLVAQQAAAALGVKPEAVAALEKVIGYAGVMEMFRNIGSKIGEDKFVVGNTAGGGTLDKQQAQAQLNDLKQDKEWVTRYLNGGVAEKKLMSALTTIISG